MKCPPNRLLLPDNSALKMGEKLDFFFDILDSESEVVVTAEGSECTHMPSVRGQDI